MIDTFAFKLPVLHNAIPADKIIRISHSGEIQNEFTTRTTIEGTYTNKASIKSIYSTETGEFSHLRIEASPKFVQGHNAFGTENPQALIREIVRKVRSCLMDDFPEFRYTINPDKLDYTKIEIDRIDINRTYRLSNNNDAANWIKAAEYTSHTRHGRPVLKSSTIYWGKNSRRWSLKAYQKPLEMQRDKHLIPSSIAEPLIDYIQGCIRIELTMRQLELRRKQIKYASDINTQTISDLYTEYLGFLTMSKKLKLTHDQVENLPPKLKRTYSIWHSGSNPMDYMSKATFYKHRKELSQFDIDISNPFKAHETNVIPLVRVLEAQPVQAPDWLNKTRYIIAA